MVEERDLLAGKIELPRFDTDFRDRPALIVVRGVDHQRDLRALRPYIRDVRPVLVGVDGGANALLEAGFSPDMIVGDMDSASEATLRCGAELVVHAYPDGRAPGREHLEALGLPHKVVPAPGTSQDIAMLIAHEKGAPLIVSVGSQFNLVEFLDKNRRGHVLDVPHAPAARRDPRRREGREPPLPAARPAPRRSLLVLAVGIVALVAVVLVTPGLRDVADLLWLKLQAAARAVAFLRRCSTSATTRSRSSPCSSRSSSACCSAWRSATPGSSPRPSRTCAQTCARTSGARRTSAADLEPSSASSDAARGATPRPPTRCSSAAGWRAGASALVFLGTPSRDDPRRRRATRSTTPAGGSPGRSACASRRTSRRSPSAAGDTRYADLERRPEAARATSAGGSASQLVQGGKLLRSEARRALLARAPARSARSTASSSRAARPKGLTDEERAQADALENGIVKRADRDARLRSAWSAPARPRRRSAGTATAT